MKGLTFSYQAAWTGLAGLAAAFTLLPLWRRAVLRAGFAHPERDLPHLPAPSRPAAVASGAGMVMIALVALAPLVVLAVSGLTSPWGWAAGERTSGMGELVAVLGGALALGLVGAGDDLIKLVRRDSRGLLARYRLPLQLAIAYLVLLPMVGELPLYGPSGVEWAVPPWLHLSLALLLVVGAVNGGNFTDGMDGLYGLTALPRLAAAMLIVGPSPLGLSLALAGGVLAGFLIFNLPPARLFLGESGAYLFSGLISLALAGKGMSLALIPLGLVWGVEALSVILQETSVILLPAI